MTIKDIARISGYGVSTVSRALNNHPDVSAQAKEKIRAVADEYNFTPNANARQLKVSCSKTVVVIVKGTFNVFFSSLVETLQTQIDRLGYGVLVHYIDTAENEIVLAKKLISEEKPLGIIFLGGSITNFKQDFDITIPCVLCSTSAAGTDFPNLSSVSVDDTDAGRKAAQYLIDCGHREIGIIGGDINTFCATQQRFSSAEKTLSQHGIKFKMSRYEYCEFTLQSAYEATKALLAREMELTAIFAMSDVIAIGACRAIEDNGLRVPGDISVIGFDGIEMASYCNPRITTFKQPDTEIASVTVRLLRDMIENDRAPEHILMKSTAVHGSSVKQI